MIYLQFVMAHAPRKIVFSMPALVPDRPAPRAADGGTRPAATGAHPEGGDVRKLATVMEVGEALAGTLNLQAGLYGVLGAVEVPQDQSRDSEAQLHAGGDIRNVGCRSGGKAIDGVGNGNQQGHQEGSRCAEHPEDSTRALRLGIHFSSVVAYFLKSTGETAARLQTI